jgi:hypothetical protein
MSLGHEFLTIFQAYDEGLIPFTRSNIIRGS